MRVPHLKSNCVLIPDNEPRNSQVVSNISRYIDEGYSVVIWPEDLQEKDVNDMVMSGHDVLKIIEEHITYGNEAKLKLSAWRKTNV